VIVLSSRDGVLLLPVRVQPGASRAGVLGEHAGRLKVAVAAPPEKGKANKALLRQLAKRLGLSRTALSLAGGETCRDKLVAVDTEPRALIEALGGLGVDADLSTP